MRKLKIISDGTNAGTKLVDAETGDKIGYVQNIKWEADVAGEVPKCVITFIAIECEIEVIDFEEDQHLIET